MIHAPCPDSFGDFDSREPLESGVAEDSGIRWVTNSLRPVLEQSCKREGVIVCSYRLQSKFDLRSSPWSTPHAEVGTNISGALFHAAQSPMARLSAFAQNDRINPAAVVPAAKVEERRAIVEFHLDGSCLAMRQGVDDTLSTDAAKVFFHEAVHGPPDPLFNHMNARAVLCLKLDNVLLDEVR